MASARQQRRATNMMKKVPANVNQNLPEGESLTAAYMENKMIQQQNQTLATDEGGAAVDMTKERAPTYSNVYDAQVRTTSEYENPYDVSRRETIAKDQNAD